MNVGACEHRGCDEPVGGFVIFIDVSELFLCKSHLEEGAEAILMQGGHVIPLCTPIPLPTARRPQEVRDTAA